MQQHAERVANALGSATAFAHDRNKEAQARRSIRGAGQSVQAKTAVLQRRGSVIQMAGTKPRVFSTNPPGKYLVKLTSDREEFIYQNRDSLGLAGVTAAYYTPKHIEQRTVPGKWFGTDEIISRVQLDDDTWIALPTGPGEGLQLPKPGQTVLVIDTIGWKATARTATEKKQTFMMDIKIGTYTKSGEQFLLEGAGGAARTWKAFEHNFKDVMQRNSRDVGYDICDGGSEFDTALERARSGENLQSFKAALGRIIADTKKIQVAVQQGLDGNHGVVYVGASVFCFFDLHDPNLSTAKLIDPDHPILTGSAFGPLNLTATPADVMDKGAFEGQGTNRIWSEYKNKWETAFMDGLKALIRYFEGMLVLADAPIRHIVVQGFRGGAVVRV